MLWGAWTVQRTVNFSPSFKSPGHKYNSTVRIGEYWPSLPAQVSEIFQPMWVTTLANTIYHRSSLRKEVSAQQLCKTGSTETLPRLAMHIGNGCPDCGLTLGTPRRFTHGDVIIYIHGADVLGTDIPSQVCAADVAAMLGAPARALHPLGGALQVVVTDQPWMENSDHLAGKKISIATGAEISITLPRRGVLDPLIHSYARLENRSSFQLQQPLLTKW